jgi:chemotaxis response regulator CheB
VMVVEDFHLFRRFVCSRLEQRPELRVICEVSDGHEAVRMAVELKPDLILLDKFAALRRNRRSYFRRRKPLLTSFKKR